MLSCVLFNHQSKESFAKARAAEALCCSLFWQRDQGREKEGFFHALKAIAFSERLENLEMRVSVGGNAAVVSL